MDAGKFKHKIAIQKKITLQDDIGQQQEHWQNYCTCFAHVNGLSGSEYWEAARQNAQNTVVFTVRYSSKISNINPLEYRIIFNSGIYDIDNVDNVLFENNIVKVRGKQNIPSDNV